MLGGLAPAPLSSLNARNTEAPGTQIQASVSVRSHLRGPSACCQSSGGGANPGFSGAVVDALTSPCAGCQVVSNLWLLAPVGVATSSQLYHELMHSTPAVAQGDCLALFSHTVQQHHRGGSSIPSALDPSREPQHPGFQRHWSTSSHASARQRAVWAPSGAKRLRSCESRTDSCFQPCPFDRAGAACGLGCWTLASQFSMFEAVAGLRSSFCQPYAKATTGLRWCLRLTGLMASRTGNVEEFV